jgi:carbon-monoxide dehydrogenase large subunit
MNQFLINGPNSLIGKSVERIDARGLVSGHGSYVDDIKLPRMLHAYFIRSPYAHARILSIDCEEVKSLPGVVAALKGSDFLDHVLPWKGILTHMASMKSATQYPLAVEKATWQGEPVAVVVATSRAKAEDASELIKIEWDPLPAVADMESAISPSTSVIHSELANNIWH